MKAMVSCHLNSSMEDAMRLPQSLSINVDLPEIEESKTGKATKLHFQCQWDYSSGCACQPGHRTSHLKECSINVL